MSLLVVGSIALDSIFTPFGETADALGGSAVYFSVAGSLLHPVQVVGVVGQDYPVPRAGAARAARDRLVGRGARRGRELPLEGEVLLRSAEPGDAGDPARRVRRLPAQAARRRSATAAYLFLGNIDPELQLGVLEQVRQPELVVCDTMNYWIQSKKAALLQLLRRVDVLMVNDSEARELSGDWNIHRAGRWILEHGPKRVVIKQGEHGALLIEPSRTFYVPAFPLETVFDPTGAGDAFAGGFMAYLARTESVTEDNIRRAMVYGAAMGSYAVEQFGIRGFDHVDARGRGAPGPRLSGSHPCRAGGGARMSGPGSGVRGGRRRPRERRRGQGSGSAELVGRHPHAAFGRQSRRVRRDGPRARRDAEARCWCSAPTASAPRCWWRSQAGRFDTVGEDLVNHSVNDILVHGATPIAFMDYIAGAALGGRADRRASWRASPGGAAPTRWRSPAARRRRCRASTARAPTTWPARSSGWSRRTEALHGEPIVPGDVLLGYASTGLHTNGYTLARRIVFDRMGLG